MMARTGGEVVAGGASVVSTRLLAVLEKFRGRPFLLIVPGGNHGDRLIWLGMHQLMQAAELPYREVVHEEFMEMGDLPPETVVYIHGGGGFVPWWSGKPMRAIERLLLSHRGDLILGPTTVHPDADFLSSCLIDPLRRMVCRSVHLFARERVSYEFLKAECGREAEVILDHDTALNLTGQVLRRLGGVAERPPCRPEKVFYFRDDREVPAELSPGLLAVDPVRCSRSFEEWVRLHAYPRMVVTNRLHSAIACYLLGTKVALAANSSHKTRAVWEFSLKDRGVEWIDAPSGIADVDGTIALVRRVRRSIAYRTFRRQLRSMLETG